MPPRKRSADLQRELLATGVKEYSSTVQRRLTEFHAEIVEVEIGGVAIYRLFGEFRRAKSYCHLYGAQGQRQAYF
ncbi:hypothetical protein TNCV_4577411 [Trichonephila clavipes]|nr:hypothetical protein TNCV_4577411 [Trichonephila clavipes]